MVSMWRTQSSEPAQLICIGNLRLQCIGLYAAKVRIRLSHRYQPQSTAASTDSGRSGYACITPMHKAETLANYNIVDYEK